MKNYLIFAYVTIVLFVLHLSTQQNDAIGYPSTSISKTTNPLWAFGGVVTSSSGVTLATAPIDQIMVLTDIHLFNNASCCSDEEVSIKVDGTIVSRSSVIDHSSSRPGTPVQISLRSGIPVPAGSVLSIHSVYGGNINYTLSGYYAQP